MVLCENISYIVNQTVTFHLMEYIYKIYESSQRNTHLYKKSFISLYIYYFTDFLNFFNQLSASTQDIFKKKSKRTDKFLSIV